MDARILITSVERTDPASVRQVHGLLDEYHAWLGDVVCSVTLQAEKDSLPAPYEPPGGVLLLARDDVGSALGCVGLCESTVDTCEMRRLYVRPAARARGVGRALVRAALDHARVIGYTHILLSTLPDRMRHALLIYRAMGFTDVAPFGEIGASGDDSRVTYLGRSL